MISVITPSFNQLDWLRLAISSVADQAGVNIEHIIQDTGSADLANLRLQTNSSSDRDSLRVQLHVEPDRGMYDAISRGLLKSKGEICAYLNCDEQYLPGALAVVRSVFEENPSVDVLLADTVVVDAAGQYICSRPALRPWLVELKAGRMHNLSCSMFFRSSLFRGRKVLFDPSLRIIGDLDWLRRVSASGARIVTKNFNASVFTDTGTNLALSPLAASEIEQAQSLTTRFIHPMIVMAHRFRRFLAGHYHLSPFDYSIYTMDNPHMRCTFHVAKPTGVWRNRLFDR